MEQRAVERHEMSFSCMEISHKVHLFLAHFLYSLVCGVASLLAFGKWQGGGMAAVNTLCCFVFRACLVCSPMLFFLLRREKY